MMSKLYLQGILGVECYEIQSDSGIEGVMIKQSDEEAQMDREVFIDRTQLEDVANYLLEIHKAAEELNK